MAPGGAYPFPDEIRDRNTGRPYDPARWAEGQERRADLLRQSRWMADALEREGIRARELGDEAVDIDHVLGTVEVVERFRPIRFLPVIMQRDSAELVAALRYFMHNHAQGTYARMAVITGGARVPALGRLRDRHKAMTRAISKWAAEARLLFGVEVVFRGMEYTRDEEQPGDLETAAQPATYHLHAHVIYTPTALLAEGEWERFLLWSERFFRVRLPGTRYGFTDCGRIQEPDEACKYPFKPAELVHAGDAEIAWLQAELHRCNMKQALGAFRGFRRSMEDNRRTTGEELADPETGELLPVTVRAPLKVVALYGEDGSKPVLAVVHKRARPKRGDRDEVREVRERDPDMGAPLRENCLLFTSNPTSSACPWATIKTRVVGYTEAPTTRAGFEGLVDLAAITAAVRKAWDANEAPPPLRIPMMMEAQAARIEREAAEAQERGIASREDEKAARCQVSRLKALAGRLRAAMGGPKGEEGAQPPQAPEGRPYGVHTCSLTVPGFGDGEATGVGAGASSDPPGPPRSDFEASSAPSADLFQAPERPHHARSRLDAQALERAPLRVCRAVADYEAWWQENRARIMEGES